MALVSLLSDRNNTEVPLPRQNSTSKSEPVVAELALSRLYDMFGGQNLTADVYLYYVFQNPKDTRLKDLLPAVDLVVVVVVVAPLATIHCLFPFSQGTLTATATIRPTLPPKV